MEQFYELHGLKVSSDKKKVLDAIDCYPDNPVYDEIAEEYDEIFEEMLSVAEPVGILGFGKLPKEIETEEYREGTPVIYAVTSIGGGISQRSTQAFGEGDYVKGMLCDAIADDALFSMEDQLVEQLKLRCAEHHTGILRRLEAPHDLPMEAQRVAWKYLELQRRFGIGISEGYMLDPVKTSCQVFVLTDDEEKFRAEHDCRRCKNVNCRFRNIPEAEITVKEGAETRRIRMNPGESLMEGLIREGYYISAICGGKGRCGKCRVQVLGGGAPITAEDRKAFSENELAEGWRLSCMLYPKEDLEISFALDDESQFEILSDETPEEQANGSGESAYEIAVDIGTTTIAMELIGKDSGKNLHTVTLINSQRLYGADVISRIQASNDGKKEELQKHIRADLLCGIRKLTDEAQVPLSKVKRIAIAGNTTMGHLLMGYPCDTLGVYPFTPVNIDLIHGTFEQILGSDECAAEVILLPGISTYVGGDIVSGLYAYGFDSEEEVCLLVDLGTNGEMAIGKKDKILVASTAAGPAFEGGNITWGTGSIAGAICSVEIHEEKPTIKTIRNQPPVGICGTGAIETLSELVREELVDSMGLLDEKYFSEGFLLGQTQAGEKIVFTQQDIRELQLAKAAVRAGVETLLVRYGITADQVSKVYLAGGFGYKLDRAKAARIGMVPEEFLDRIHAVGNSSLAGAVKFLGQENGEEVLQKIVEKSTEIGLSTDKNFNEFYMDAMLFGEE
ncbi:MAG: ASKHA domain-containing protein [Fusicatenibacter sp.]